MHSQLLQLYLLGGCHPLALLLIIFIVEIQCNVRIVLLREIIIG